MTTKAWATLVTRPSYVPGVLALHRTLVSVSDYPLVVLVTDSLGPEYRALIKAKGMEVVEIDHLQPAAGSHKGFDAKFERFADTWTKLQVFGLSQFDTLVLIDADTIFLRGMDELFDLDLPRNWIAASPVCACNPFQFAHYPSDWVPANCALSHQPRPTTIENTPQPAADAGRTAHLLNSGVVVLRPSVELMDELVNHLDTSPTIADAQFPDQDVLAEVFRGRWRVLPWWANALKTERAVHKNVWDDKEVRLLHYILEKPWKERPAAPEKAAGTEATEPVQTPDGGRRPLPAALRASVATAPVQESMTDYSIVHSWWWDVYDEVLADMKREGGEWELVDQWVKH